MRPPVRGGRPNHVVPPLVLAIYGEDWLERVNWRGVNRFHCRVVTCKTKLDYARKDGLNRHLMAKHDKKTALAYWGGHRRVPRPAPLVARPNIGQARHQCDPSKVRSTQASASTTRLARQASCHSVDHSDGIVWSVDHALDGSPDYCSRMPSITRPAMDIDNDSALDYDSDKENLSPVRYTKYGPRHIIISARRSIQELIFLQADGSTITKYYVDCNLTLTQAQGVTSRRPIVLGESSKQVRPDQKNPVVLGSLNLQWDGGAKNTFRIPVGDRKIEVIRDLRSEEEAKNDPRYHVFDNAHAYDSDTVEDAENTEGNEKDEENPSVTQMMTDLLLNESGPGQTQQEHSSMLGESQPLPELSQLPTFSQLDLPSVSQLLLVSQFPRLSQIPTLSELSLPPISPMSSPDGLDKYDKTAESTIRLVEYESEEETNSDQ